MSIPISGFASPNPQSAMIPHSARPYSASPFFSSLKYVIQTRNSLYEFFRCLLQHFHNCFEKICPVFSPQSLLESMPLDKVPAMWELNI
jgi:hypothetical protein